MTDPERSEQFTALYDRHYRRVYAYAVSRAGRGLAEEIVSEVFLIAWRRLADLPAQHELPWLLTVARNVAASEFRAAIRQQSIAAEIRSWTTEADLATGDIADGIAERMAVLSALATLGDADRELLTLVAWHGLSPGEAASVVGCSTAAYFVRLHRARRRLERAMHGLALAGTGGPAKRTPRPTRSTPPPEPPPACPPPASELSVLGYQREERSR